MNPLLPVHSSNSSSSPPAAAASTSQAVIAGHHHFSLALPAKLIAYAVLLGGVGYAMHAFTQWAFAMPVAVVMTFVFGALVDIAVSPTQSKRTRALALLGAVALGTITTSLAYASYYARTSAPESARRAYLAHKDSTEREVQRLLTLASTAESAMKDWSTYAADKAAVEQSSGHTCASRDSDGVFGPITRWRQDDSRIAGNLGRELGELVAAARSAAQAVAALPAADDFAAVKAGYAALNTAIDRTAPLTKAGWADGALKVLAERSSSLIEHPKGQFSCGDSARMSYLERAGTELKKLNDAHPMARVQPAIDLDRPMEVVTRGLIRGATLSARLVTVGHAGSFADDPLMQQQLDTVGWIGRETIPYLLSLLAEAGVLLTSFVAAQAGGLPFRLSLPAWVARRDSARAAHGRLFGLAQLLGKLISNLFWVTPAAVPATGTAHAVATKVVVPDAPESSNFGIVDFPPDPVFRERERDWAPTLAQWHHAWGMADYLVIPSLHDHQVPRGMARSLAAQGTLTLVADGVPGTVLIRRRPQLAALIDRLGPTARDHAYDVWQVKPDYGQIIRMAALNQLQQPSAGPAPTAP